MTKDNKRLEEKVAEQRAELRNLTLENRIYKTDFENTLTKCEDAEEKCESTLKFGLRSLCKCSKCSLASPWHELVRLL